MSKYSKTAYKGIVLPIFVMISLSHRFFSFYRPFYLHYFILTNTVGVL